MSRTITIPTPRRRRREWTDTDAVALAVADVNSIHVTAHTVRGVVSESLRRHGGPDGVQTELEHRLAEAPHRTTRTLAWARGVLASLREVDSA